MFIYKNLQKPTFHEGKSKRLGLDFFVISSGLQKSIRRGEIDNSMIYARELIESGFEKYIWKRIFIYVVEDIGLANLYMGETVLNHYKLFKQSETEFGFDARYIYQVIYLLSISQKNRENDSMICLVKLGGGDGNDKKFISELCNEKIYNSNSKKVKENIKNFFDLEFKGCMYEKLYNSYLECMMTLWDLNGGDGLCLYFINFYLIKKYNYGYIEYKDGVNRFIKSIQFSLKEFRYNFIDISGFKVEDYVFDKHTILGKKMGRGLKYFFEVGSYLENEVPVGGNRYKKEIDEMIKNGLIIN